MKTPIVNNDLHFLAGGGELGKLTRDKDWSLTPLGPTQSWPQSLRTSLSIILNSKFPMFLFWGKDLSCFYNDAYRPSLGKDGKHPSILGMKGSEAWPEIWPIIKPLIDQVLSGGEASWSEDQLIPIYRNGKIEDVYWTFSYSPVNDESGKPAGVFVTCSETTEKVRVYDELKESKSQLEFTIESAELGIWDYNPLNNQFTCNSRVRDWFGLGPDEQVELWHAIDAIVDIDRERVTKAIQHALSFSSGGNYDVEYTLVHPLSKVTTILRAKGKAWFDDKNIAYRFNGTLQDVTTQALARAKVEGSEARFRSLIAQLPMATVFLKGPEHIIEVVNSAMLKRWGRTENELLNKRFADVFPEVKEQKFANLLSEVYATGKSHREAETPSFLFINGVKRTFYVDFEYSPLLESDGTVVGIIATVVDVTEKVASRKIVEESERRFRLLADAMPQHIWTSDTEGNLNYFNKSVFDFSGLSVEQINRGGWLQIVHPDDRDENIRQWTQSITTGTDFLYEHRFRRHDGQYRWQLSRAIPHRDENGKIQIWVGTSTDIQDQKTFANELEKQVENRTRELEQNNIELSRINIELQSFAYISSHDLQEPLRKIQTFASRLREAEEARLSDNGKHYLKRMESAAERMQNLIQDLLSYSRTDVSEIKKEKLSLQSIIDDVTQEFAEEINQKNVTVNSSTPCNVDVIPFQFRQVVSNLMSNALKFAALDRPLVISITSVMIDAGKIKLDGLKPGTVYCHIAFTDNGIGFDQKYSEKIFALFQRLHAKGDFEGTGIGLAIVKKIIENHGGIVTATSELNKGTTLDIYLPVA